MDKDGNKAHECLAEAFHKPAIASANAAFIVRAVNAHDFLIGRFQAFASAAHFAAMDKSGSGHLHDLDRCPHVSCAGVRADIAKAEAKS